MNLDDLPPPEVMWAGKYVRVLKRDKWEYASRTNSITAVVVLAEYEGKVILVDQPRVPTDCRCIELPAGLVGDTDPNATVEATAIKELEEETGFTASDLRHLGRLSLAYGLTGQGYDVFLATGLVPGPPAREASEQDMVCRWSSDAELVAMLRSGEIEDASTVAACTLLLLDGTLRPT